MPDGEEEGTEETRRVPNRMPDPVGEVVTALDAFGIDRQQVGTGSTPFGILSPGLGSSTLETRRQPALEAVLQTQADPLPVTTSPSRLPPHAELHMAGGDDEVHSFDIISVYDQINMRSGWEDETGRSAQEEITPRSGTAIQTQVLDSVNSAVLVDTPIISLTSQTPVVNPTGNRIRAEFAARQGNVDKAFINVTLRDSALSIIRDVRIIAVVDSPSDVADIRFRATADDNTFVQLTLRANGVTNVGLATFSGTGTLIRVTGIDTPALSADAVPKNYVDGLTVPVVAEGDIIVGDATPAWAVLTLAVPAASVRNVLGVDNGETQPTWKAGLDATNPADIAVAAGPGTSLIFSHRDHIHAYPSGDAYNGSFLEPMTFVVTSNGTTITGTIDKNPTGDLTERFSDGISVLSSGGTVTLTAGDDDAPQKNFVYVLQSNKGVLVASTDWPSAEHIRVAEVIVQSISTVQTEGPLVNRNWNDFAKGADGQGHHLHAWARLRFEHSVWKSGVAITWTIDSAPSPDTINLALTAGKVYQLHLQNVEAKDTAGGDNVHVVNDSGTPYTTITDFADLLTDNTGSPMSGKYFSLVVWSSVSSGSEPEHLFVNLPSGSYNKEGDAIADVSGYTVFDIPSDFRGQAFLVSRITLRHQAAGGGTWTSIQETDLRGQVPNIVAGGGTAAITTEFADNQFRLFDDGDPTKELAFQLSGIAAGTTRIITVPDEDVSLIDDATSDPAAIGDVASDGTEGSLARKDHVHATGGTADGDLGGTYPNPTVDATHSGSPHDNLPTQSGTINMGGNSIINILTLQFGSPSDVTLSRGAANRLDLATGDSLEIVSGNINIGGNLTLTGTVDGVDIAARDHAEAHVLATTGPHTGSLPWSDLNLAASSLADLATRAHANLSDAPTDAHHAQAHAAAQHNAAALPGSANESLGAFFLDIDDIAVPANPAATVRRLFVDTATGALSVRTSAGATVNLEAAAGYTDAQAVAAVETEGTVVKILAEVYT